jgi:hypothetical protein
MVPRLVTADEKDGADGKHAAITLIAEPGLLMNFGPIDYQQCQRVG